jgi:hypothetical protein
MMPIILVHPMSTPPMGLVVVAQEISLVIIRASLESGTRTGQGFRKACLAEFLKQLPWQP